MCKCGWWLLFELTQIWLRLFFYVWACTCFLQVVQAFDSFKCVLDEGRSYFHKTDLSDFVIFLDLVWFFLFFCARVNSPCNDFIYSIASLRMNFSVKRAANICVRFLQGLIKTSCFLETLSSLRRVLKKWESRWCGLSPMCKQAVYVRKQSCGHLSVIVSDVTPRHWKCAEEWNEHLCGFALPLHGSTTLEHPLSVTTTVFFPFALHRTSAKVLSAAEQREHPERRLRVVNPEQM